MKVIIIGAGGAIGQALVKKFESDPANKVFAFARESSKQNNSNITGTIDITSEDSIAIAAESIKTNVDLVLVTTGILHDETAQPEKNVRQISRTRFEHVFLINTIAPALIAKHFIPKLSTAHKSVFAALSARVGSISDNHMGGWYAYRSSKAALNMIIKNLAIETQRTNKMAIIAGLHPGTVDSPLSKPFQKNVAPEKLFTPEFSAAKLMKVIDQLTPKDSGLIFDWAGKRIPW